MKFLQVEGKHFTYNGEKIRLRGFGIGTWLNLEHFMIGIPTSEQMLKTAFEEVYGTEVRDQFFKNYYESFFKEADFKLLKECGVNYIRIPFNYRLFIDDNNTDEFKEEGFLYFDHLLSLCNKYEIFAMLDLHTSPGAQNPDWHSDNSYGVPLFWEYQALRRQVTQLWKAIASRYSEEPYLMGYDLLNEPAMAKWPMLNEFYEETIAAIREVDQNHVIILEGDHFSMDFSGLKHFDDKQLALGFHYYPTVWYPDLLDPNMDRTLRKQQIADGLDHLLNIRDQFNCPAFCGEFGYGIDCGEPEFTRNLLEDTLDLMEEREMDWVLWCYKDAHFMSMIAPKESSRWMIFAREIEAEWSQDVEKAQATAILDLIAKNYFSALTEAERYLLQFRLRANLYLLQKNHIIIPKLKLISKAEILEMSFDFSFDNCKVYSEFKDLMKKVLL